MKVADLAQAVGSAAAIRSRVKLQPAGGEGDKVFPPTYLGAKYAEEERIDPATGQRVKCVLLDSVQSQANRMEDALQDGLDTERSVPVLDREISADQLIALVKNGRTLIGHGLEGAAIVIAKPFCGPHLSHGEEGGRGE